MKRNGKKATALNEELWDAAAGRLLLAEFIRVITRTRLVVWTRPEGGDAERFEAALDTGRHERPRDRPRGMPPHDASDIEIMVRPRMIRGGRRGKGFVAQVSWYDENDDVVAELETDIDAELYAEVEESWRASGSGHMQVSVIRRGAAPTMRPYGPADEEGGEENHDGEGTIRPAEVDAGAGTDKPR